MKEVDSQLAALDESRARGLRAMTKGLLSEDEFAELAAELDAQRAPLRQRRDLLALAQQTETDRAARLKAIEAQVAEIAPRLGKLSFEERRALLHDLVEEVTVDTRARSIEVVTLLGLVGPAAGDTNAGSGVALGRGKAKPRLAAARHARVTPKRKGLGTKSSSKPSPVCQGAEAP